MSQSLVLPNKNSEQLRLDISRLSRPTTEGVEYEYLAVFVKNDKDDYLKNAVQGKHTIEGHHLIFIPHFPFEKGLTYVARIQDPKAESEYVFTEFKVGEKGKVEEAKLLSIYPTAATLPENLLRFYFYFNTPMKKGQVVRHIKLVDTEGKIDSRAFMEFKQELWSADGKRLTLLFDPGRIKRGVSTNTELGPALLVGKQYSLTISGSWEDVYGQKISTAVTKEFTVGAAYRSEISVQDWSIRPPQLNSEDNLSIHFDRIMDHALVQSMIKIIGANNQKISGTWETSKGEKTAQFTPEQPWQGGNYQIVFDPRMEDVVGNNMEGLLDHKTSNSDRVHEKDYSINFKL